MTDTYALRTAFFEEMRGLSYSNLETYRPTQIFDPKTTPNTVSVREGHLIGPVVTSSAFGNGRYSRLEGYYQINIWVPRRIDGALERLDELMDGHREWFFPTSGRGKSVTYGSQSAYITERPESTNMERQASYLYSALSIPFWIEEYPS